MTLPIKKVVLYKHGVGYFERAGKVSGNAKITLQFRVSEMNDVLKSLTIQDLSGGTVSSISYESTKSTEEQLKDVAIHLDNKNSLTGLLNQIRGAAVDITIGTEQITGTVIGTQSVPRKERETTYIDEQLILLITGAQIRSFNLQELKSIDLLDAGLKKDLQHLLDVLVSAKKQEIKELTIFTKGTDEREIIASYVIETPVWKTSYRILLQDVETLIQGWALVDNTQDEDWEEVSLSLVAGLPVSFIHDLYTARFKRRPVIEVKEEEAYASPELEAGGEFMDLLAEEAAPAAAAGAVLTQAAAKPSARAKKRAFTRERTMNVQTRVAEIGDLFQYHINHPVNVKRGQSALVPILQTVFQGKRVAVYNQDVRDKNPMSAVLFNNTTSITLEGGPVTIIEDDTYVGEAMLETMRPDDKRLLPYSVELGCVITIDHRSDQQQVHFCKIARGSLQLYHYEIRDTIYNINNKTDKELDLFLDHRFQPHWKLVSDEKPVEQTDNFYRFRFNVQTKATIQFKVSEKGDMSSSAHIGTIKWDDIQLWLQKKYIDNLAKSQLEEIVTTNERITRIKRDVESLDEELKHVFENQKRIRDNLKSLGASQDEKSLRERYVKQLNEDEDKIADRKNKITVLKQEKEQMERALQVLMDDLKYENTL
jgi:hypothetical protein